jgi:hypothetical protein
VNIAAAVKGHISDTGQAARYLMIDRIEEALDSLDKAYLAHDPNLPYLIPVYGNLSPALKAHPRFQLLLEKMNLPPIED